MNFILSRGYTTLGLSHVTPDTSSKHEENEGCGTLIVMAKPRCVHLLAQVMGHRSNVTLGGRSKRPENETTLKIQYFVSLSVSDVESRVERWAATP